jgi:hypothetical protein
MIGVYHETLVLSLQKAVHHHQPQSRYTIGKVVLNYARSRNPTCVRAHTQRHIQDPREPLNLGVFLRVCALSQGRT